jgi:hypothetical protein
MNYEPLITIQDLPNPNILDLDNQDSRYYGPIVDASDLVNGINVIGRAYNYYDSLIHQNMGVDVRYKLYNGTEIKFRISIEGFKLDDYKEDKNILSQYEYQAYFQSMTIDRDWTDSHTFCNHGLPDCSNYFNQYLTMKDITFFTDILLDYVYFGDRKLTEEQLNDYKFLNKLRESYRKIDKLQEDFK